ncbi:MAG: HAD family hydrolase [Treponema sp.]|nr:HAD family hydrolase [Treponema sp.]
MNLIQDFDGIIFDFDGTLYDNHGIAKELIKARPFDMFTMLAERKTRAQLRGQYFGSESQYRKAYVNCLSKKSILPKSKVEKWYFEVFMGSLVKILPIKFKARPRINEIFDYLKSKGKKIVVLSDYNLVAQRMTALGISTKNVDFMHSSEDLGGLKPAKEIFLKVSQEMGLPPQRILVIGDREDTDGLGAFYSKMKFIQIKTVKTKNCPQNGEYPLMSWDEFTKFVFSSEK